MIKRIRLENFLSYENEEVELEGATISVSGDNGSGKSSLLEAIPYTYFGIGRDTMSGMSRINGDGSHQVTIWEDDGTEVRRGRKANGSGFFEVRINRKLVAKGREADEWVKNHLGMDGDTYMLTAFFGLHDVRHDTLIRVAPAARLEALQKLSEVGPYKKLLKAAKERYDEEKRAHDAAESKKSGAESALIDEKELKKTISDLEYEIERATKDTQSLKGEKDDLLVEEDKYQAFLREKSELGVERKNLEQQISDLEDERDRLLEEKRDLSETLTEEIERKKKCVEDEVLKLDPETLEKSKGDLQQQIGSVQSVLSLKKKAIEESSGIGNTCPLCGSTIDDGIVDRWKEDVEKMRGKLDTLKSQFNHDSNSLKRYTDISSQIDELSASIKSATKEGSEIEKRLTTINRDLSRFQAEQKKKDGRYIDLQEKLGDEYRELHTRIEEVNDRLDEAAATISEAKGEIKAHQQSLQSNKKAKKLISDCEKDMKEHRQNMRAAKLLIGAWNRYGIPLRLMKETMAAIEERATAVYQEFDSAKIAVVEVEDRGKPGVEFTLIDRKGSRTFGQLSAGEKVMFFIAVRVAIAQLVAANSNVSVDYLILDEAMGNLSPGRRDDLVRLINKMLRKMFPQVIMVSHTEMRDIFSSTLKVSAESGVSKVEVMT